MTRPVSATNPLAAAADYADALIVARRLKTTLCTLLWFVLGTELSLFVLLRYVASVRSLIVPTAAANPAAVANSRAVLQYAVGLLDFGGLILPLVLVAMVTVVLLVQVAARTVGAGRTTSALGWAVLLAVLLFPWQAVLNNPAINADKTQDAIGMKVPGVVYTWAEVSHPDQGAAFADVHGVRPGTGTGPATSEPSAVVVAVLHWVRYAVFPALAMVIVGLVHAKTEQGLRLSFGTATDPAGGDGVVDDAAASSDVIPRP